MSSGYRYFSSLLAMAALFSPAALSAHPRGAKQDDDHRDKKTERYYDKEAKDYHEWNENEERSWKRYETEMKHEDRDFAKENAKQQEEYWKWRHKHPDADEDRH